MESFDIFLEMYSLCNGHSKLFMLLFRDKGIILMLIHSEILNLVVHLRDKGVFRTEMLRKGCDISIMNFRDTSAFQNSPDTHVNKGFY